MCPYNDHGQEDEDEDEGEGEDRDRDVDRDGHRRAETRTVGETVSLRAKFEQYTSVPSPVKEEFPTNLRLGTTTSTLIPIVHEENRTYEIPLDGLLEDLGTSKENLNQGHTSPVRKVTLSAPARRLAKIPLAATKFCWAYPLPEARELLKQKTSPDLLLNLRLILNGGFLYLDDEGKCIKANAVVIGTGLLFRPPESWRAEFTEGLDEEERIKPVTIPQFNEKGAQWFCWIHAGETLKSKQGESWTVSEHGAFMYLFSGNPLARNSKDIFFSIDPGTKESDVWYVI